MAIETIFENHEGESQKIYEGSRVVASGAVVGLGVFYMYDTRVYDEIDLLQSEGLKKAKQADDTSDAIMAAQQHLQQRGVIDGPTASLMEREVAVLGMEAQATRQDLPNINIERAKLVGSGVVPFIVVAGIAVASRRYWSKYRRGSHITTD